MVTGPLILIVDDDEDIRDAGRAALEQTGYSVEVAADGVAALVRLTMFPAPTLILLDLMMPRMDGVAFLDEWARRADLPRIPIVVMTASTPTFAASLASRYPVLHKPLDLDHLLRIVKSLTGSSPTAM